MLNVSMADPDHNLRPRLSVVGVGGAGGNAINNMIRCGLEGCDFIAANTDSQALALSLATRKIQLGVNMSRGLGAGSKPDIGRAAAEEQLADIMACLDGSDMIFITAGMGGGTGTGAAPVIARAAREAGILTVGVVTKPFHFEGSARMRQAENGIAELQQFVDTLIVIPNQNLFRIANERTTFAEAFRLADEVLHSGVRGITDLMVMPGFMNLDFADVKTVMGEMGKAMMGTGEAEGDNRAILAAEAAISNPLLDDVSMKGARGVLINITGGLDMTLFEVDQSANRIREEVDSEAQIKVGSTLSEDLQGRIRVSVIATGIDAEEIVQTEQQSSAGKGAGQASQRFRVAADASPKAKIAPQQVVTPSLNTGSGYFTMPQAVSSNTAPVASSASFSANETVSPPTAEKPTASPVAAATQAAQNARALASSFSATPRSPAKTSPRPSTNTSSGSTAPVSKQPVSQTQDTRVTQLTAASSPTASDQRRMRRSESLFTRITGFGLVRPSAQKHREDEIIDEADLADDIASQPTLNEPHLSVDPTDRPPMSSDQPTDLLDIPAFLRRQTNH